MKKVLCGILATIMAFGLCACDSKGKAKTQERDEDADSAHYEEDSNYHNSDYTEATPGPEQSFPDDELMFPQENKIPTDEEMEMMSQYAQLVSQIHAYNCFQLDNQQRQDYYLQIQGMGAIDKWYGTEYASMDYLRERDYESSSYFNEETDWNRQYIMSQLYTVEDVYLYTNLTTIDKLGNTDTGMLYNGQINHYNADGTLRHIQCERTGFGLPLSSETNIYMVDVRDMVYDENGNVIKKVTRNGDYNSLIQTLTYNERGQLVQLNAKNNYNEQTLSYFYNDEGQISAICWDSLYDDETRFEMLYTYNEAGQLLKEEYTEYQDNVIDERWVLEYRYDENGTLYEATYCNQTYLFGVLWAEMVYLYEYTMDSQNRILTRTEHPGSQIYYDQNGNISSISESNDNTLIYEYVYGTYYGICNLEAE